MSEKIAAPTDDKIKVAEHFGRCKYFIITENTKNKTNTANTKTIRNEHDKILPAEKLKQEEVSKIIVKNIGEKAKTLLKKYRIKVLEANMKQ